MKPAPFDYACPTTTNEAVALLTDTDVESKILAGGQSLVPLLSMRLARPTRLIDLNQLPELAYIQTSRDNRVHIGAMTRQSELIRQDTHPLIAHAAGWIGHAAIRTRGTLGGSIAHADPSAELPAVAVACDAEITVAGPGIRTVHIDALFESALQTTLAEDELIESVSFNSPHRWGFSEMARRHGDFALVLAVVAELADGWRVVIGGVDSTPWRCTAAEALLDNGGGIDEVIEAVADTCPAFDDLHAPADYRRAMAAHHVGQAALHALEVER